MKVCWELELAVDQYANFGIIQRFINVETVRDS